MTTTAEGKMKALPAARGYAVVVLALFRLARTVRGWRFGHEHVAFPSFPRLAPVRQRWPVMSAGDDDLRVRPGRIRSGGQSAGKAQSFVGQVMRAAKKAGHTGRRFAASGRARSTFGRGRVATVAATLRSPTRRVLVKTRIARHRGTAFRSAPLSTHVRYLQRDGVSRDGSPGAMFDAERDGVDGKAFADRCEGDRHHFRFIVSPEDAERMQDLRAFTRDLMADAERDLGTKLEWVAVDHHNTDNPHVHILVRGRTQDGDDLVISRDYLTRGLRGRAEQLVSLELGPRTEQEIGAALAREVTAERWTGLDRALRQQADREGGVADLRPGGPADADPSLRRLMVGRAQHLERLGVTSPIGPAQWSLAPGAESTLRALGERGDIIRTMHRALGRGGREPVVADFAIHGKAAQPNVLGRLADRGLHDELSGSAYVVIEGVDGRSHHLRFASLEATGDAELGAIVEARSFEGADGKRRLALSVRSDLTLAEQVAASGATWLDRQLVSREAAPLAGNGFGTEVRAALDARAEHLAGEGLARRQGQRMVMARDLLETLQRRELDGVASRLSAETGLTHRPGAAGDHVGGVYRQRVTLASGRFAMIDNGLGFELVPWKPALERQLGQQVQGVMLPGGGVDWSHARTRGLSL
jgi:type IV secretory pathway VirD2 relaxase